MRTFSIKRANPCIADDNILVASKDKQNVITGDCQQPGM